MEVTSRAIFIDKYFHPRFIGMERSFFFLFFFQKNESRERRSGRMSYIFFFFFTNRKSNYFRTSRTNTVKG